MAKETVTTNDNGDKLMNLELLFLRQNVQFLELLLAEKRLKAKRLALRADFFEGLYRHELKKQGQQEQQAKEDKGGAA